MITYVILHNLILSTLYNLWLIPGSSPISIFPCFCYDMIHLSYFFHVFHSFTDLSFPYHKVPYIIWQWLTSCDLLPYMISGSSQDLSLLVITHNPSSSPLIAISSFTSLSSTPYPSNWSCTASIVMLHIGSTSLITTLWLSSLLYSYAIILL